jgi:flagellar hook-length control protein FliK
MAAAGPPVTAPEPAHGPPGRTPGRPFEPVLHSQQERPAREATEREARPAPAEGTEPEADDHGKAEGDRPAGGAARAAASNGVGQEVSRAAHEARAQGLPVAEAVHAALASLRGPAAAETPPAATEPTADGVVPAVREGVVAPAAAVPAGEPSEAPSLLAAAALVPAETAAAETAPVTEAVAPDAPASDVPASDVPASDVPAPAVPAGDPAESLAPPVSVDADPAAPAPTTHAPAAPAPGAEPSATAPEARPAAVSIAQPASRPAVADASLESDIPADAVEPETEPAPPPSRPGHVPEHGRGGEMRREDPPAHGWHRKHDTAPEGAPAPPPAAHAAPSATEPVTGEQARPAAPTPATAAAPVEQVAMAGVERPEAPIRAGARLAELADTVRTVVRLAAEDGRTSARITLYPAELGEVRIRLRYEGGGIAAEVLAESQQAAQALQQAAPELRRSLESQGLNLLWLDVRSGDAESEAPWLGEGTDAGSADDAAADTAEEYHVLPGRLPAPGSTIDVLA